MAKFYVGKGMEQYLAMLGNLEFRTDELIGEAIYEGAKIVADEVSRAIDTIPSREKGSSSGVYEDQRQGLKDGFGIARLKNENGYLNVKLGFDGYNKHVTKTYPNGQPNALIARAINSGTSFAPKYPFVDRTTRNCKSEAEAAMMAKIDSGIKQIAGGN